MKKQTYTLGATVAVYTIDETTGRAELSLVPTALQTRVVPRRSVIEGVEIDAYAASLGTTFAAWEPDSLVQLKQVGDAYPAAFANGRTLRESGTVASLRFAGQRCHARGHQTHIQTKLVHPAGWLVVHSLRWTRGTPWLESWCTIQNPTVQPLALELAASFSLGGMTPFAADDAPHRLKLHRFRSVWSMEGRIETRTLEELQLERSWIGWGARVERFGVAGSMPVNGWFPRALVEDTSAGVVWGAQLCQPGSWQLEVYRRGDTVALSGGLADRELGHWVKRIAPGESFATPRAQLACVAGTVDDACDALTSAQEKPATRWNRREASLPVVVNDWATHWGSPSHARIVGLADTARKLGARYLVIDAGWYAPADGNWSAAHGDWLASVGQFPRGLRATADAIRAAGLVPGLWFEFETCGRDSALYQRREFLLTRDGEPITTGTRRHLDLRKPAVIAYLARRVIGLLRHGRFGYLKIDYNETLGLGADGAESPGEALRQQLAAAQAFIARIRAEIPGLVIENCSSGGHRLEPSMFALTDMSSFSDAHECPEIPVIAANLHRLMLPRMEQVWVVLRRDESRHRTVYSLAAGFLGRLCLSGDLTGLSAEQLRLTRTAVRLYRRSAAVIRRGHSRRFGPVAAAYRHLKGWQAVRRVRHDSKSALVIVHTFGGPIPRRLNIPLSPGDWQLDAMFAADDLDATIARGALSFTPGGSWRGFVFLVSQTKS